MKKRYFKNESKDGKKITTIARMGDVFKACSGESNSDISCYTETYHQYNEPDLAEIIIKSLGGEEISQEEYDTLTAEMEETKSEWESLWSERTEAHG